MTRNVALEDRTMKFATECHRVCGILPANRVGSPHIAEELSRASTGVAANYAEVCQSESARDFIRKLKITLKGLNEARIWLRIIHDSHYVPADDVTGPLVESEELTRIFSASVATARRNLMVA